MFLFCAFVSHHLSHLSSHYFVIYPRAMHLCFLKLFFFCISHHTPPTYRLCVIMHCRGDETHYIILQVSVTDKKWTRHLVPMLQCRNEASCFPLSSFPFPFFGNKKITKEPNQLVSPLLPIIIAPCLPLPPPWSIVVTDYFDSRAANETK